MKNSVNNGEAFVKFLISKNSEDKLSAWEDSWFNHSEYACGMMDSDPISCFIKKEEKIGA